MDLEQTSSDGDSTSEGDMLHLDDTSVLIQFIYDTSAFSDRLVQLTIDTTTEPARAEDHGPASGPPEANTTDEKDTESTGNSFYPEYLVVE